MPRPFLLLFLLALPGCQGNGSHPSTGSSLSNTFDPNTVQTYDIQTGEYHQQPPFGARSNQSQ